MSELYNFPLRSQLSIDAGEDGANSEYNCIPVCVCASLEYLTGNHYHPDALKDAVYGRAWANEGTSVAAFVPYCLAQGVILFTLPCQHRPLAVIRAREELAKSRPVLFAQQDDYSPGHPDWKHTCVFYKETERELTCLDPYGGFALTHSDTEWAARMRSSNLWVMARIP